MLFFKFPHLAADYVKIAMELAWKAYGATCAPEIPRCSRLVKKCHQYTWLTLPINI